MNAPLPTDPPSDEKPCPFDLGMSIDVWADEDPVGFDAAITEAYADSWSETLAEMLTSRSAYYHTTSTEGLEKVMDKRLEQVVASNPQWVQDWMRERTEGVED